MDGPQNRRGEQRTPRTGNPSRGQSETIGVILLTGVLVVTSAVTGAVLLSQLEAPDEPTTNLVVEVNASTLAVEHDGGDSLPLDDVTVVLGGDVDDERELADFSEDQGNGNDRFEAGERRTDAHGATDSVTVLVVDDPSNTILLRENVDVQ
jgi:FlaG/FlaF family flagellin (archaellin)